MQADARKYHKEYASEESVLIVETANANEIMGIKAKKLSTKFEKEKFQGRKIKNETKRK